jgi:hypothetical protein
MPFEIPKEDVAAVSTLKAMPNVSVDAFVNALKSIPPSTDIRGMARGIAKRLPLIPIKDLEGVLDTLFGLYYIRELSGVPPQTFLQDFMEGVQKVPELAVPKQEVPKLRAKFEKLLNIDAFTILSKAKRLQRDGERLYCDAKILSDIRPVFGNKPTNRPVGAVVSHTLRVTYHEGADLKDFHIILDSIDLEMLGDVIGRAYAKDKTLRDLLRNAKLPDLGT